MHVIGIIGGSGLYEMEGLSDVREVVVETPFGEPSDALMAGKLGDTQLYFLPRHGRGHRFTPSEVNYRANIWALKAQGVQWILGVSAVGSLREDIVPGHCVIIDQYIDRTRGRPNTFFGDGVVAHVAFGDPICEGLRGYLLQAARQEGATVHDRGTYVCMEGPAFSTRAESNLYRSWGADVVGMTNLPEAKLAREAEISYATLAMATDYDCWYAGHDDVTVDQVIAVLRANASLAARILRNAIPRIAAHEGPNPMHDALATALITPRELIGPEQVEALGPILSKYV